ncbi:MAG: hypothetical protein HQL07_11730, partial [Nitrospirae bacterium]|nr:hypothetical protein [Magnetococcales bacterium]
MDSKKTTVSLNTTTMQVHQGNSAIDKDGQRTATVLFPAGVTAAMVMPDGSSQPLTNMTVRATEFTVGDNGPRAMPGVLPATSGYTYALELSVDEAMAAGATDVQFSKALPFYVENFIGFPVGTIVPAGYYDRKLAAWIPSQNGRVIGVLAEENGQAILDINGNGQPATTTELTQLGITTEELTKLATLYNPGVSYWRVPVKHFTPWDCNWPVGPPMDSIPPPSPDAIDPDPVLCPGGNCPKISIEGNPQPILNNPACQGGSVIECENQVLGESIPIAGTPFSLNYRSNRSPGFDNNTYRIFLSGSKLPASLERIDLEFQIAGRSFTQSFPAAPNQNYDFVWDGKDAYGRPVVGFQEISGNVRYVYKGTYYSPANFELSFGRTGSAPIVGIRSRNELMVLRPFNGQIQATFDALEQGLGGWNINVNHLFFPGKSGGVLLKGDGSQRSFDGQDPLLRKLVGTLGGLDRPYSPYECATHSIPLGDGGPVSEACIGWIISMALAPDGSIFLSDFTNWRIRKITPDGIIDTIPGGEHISANHLALLPDGTLLFHQGYNSQLSTLSPSGVLGTFYSNQYNPVTSPSDPAVGRDGSVYVGSSFFHKIYRIWPDRSPILIAGNGTSGFSGDGGPATEATLSEVISGLAVGDDGTVYLADLYNNRIRKITPNGIITTIAGGGTKATVEDGDQATELSTVKASDIVFGPDGSLYVADQDHMVVWKITQAGRIYSVAGLQNQSGDFSGDAIPSDARFNGLSSILVLQNGTILVGDSNNQLRIISPQATGTANEGDLLLPSEDGTEIYGFTPEGLHLSTINALTGTAFYTFAHDSKNRLISITDGDGDVTTIQRDSGGLPSAIIAPDGQRTQISLDEKGRMIALTNPGGETHNITYGPTGLMASFSTPEHHVTTFSYDSLGRLLREENPADGSWTLAKAEVPGGREVSMTSALGRAIVYSSVANTGGGQLRRQDHPDGNWTETLVDDNGTTHITSANGMVLDKTEKPDPRFRMLAPLAVSTTTTTPGGRIHKVTMERTVTGASSKDPRQLQQQQDKIIVNGKTHTTLFDRATLTLTNTSPKGR